MNKLLSIYEHAKQFGIFAKKALSQNFLFDENLNDKIVRLAGKIEGREVIEIGPGPGGLTRSILKCNPAKLIVIEKDERCIELLHEIKQVYPQLEIISADALQTKIKDLSSKVKIISNLPYSIGTVLLFNWLGELEYIEDMTLMFQREVAYRICAKENTAAYGKLSVMVQIRAEAEKLLDLSPKAFTPPPKVSSAIVHIKPLKQQLDPQIVNIVKKLVEAGFSNRRKMIKKSLGSVVKDSDIYNKINLNPTLRAENLSLQDYINIANQLIS